jgi:DNA (cytosine-5)-methyltransferase 1
MTAFYNEIEPYPLAWLANLQAADLIMKGPIDGRSIRDLRPEDLEGHTRAHFFAGVAGWDLALQLAGWPAEREVWTGSCPCQPFSGASHKRRGFDDERHLWPDFFRLIEARRPAVVLGEQVATADGLAWLDLVFDDLEGAGYTCRAYDLCSAGVGAPTIRQRLWWRADRMGDTGQPGLEGHTGDGHGAPGRALEAGPAAAAGGAGGLVHTDGKGWPPGWSAARAAGDRRISAPAGSADGAVPTHGFWALADWLLCRDPGAPRWRPVEPGTFPLAPRLSAKLEQLRTLQIHSWGNAINPQVAAAFIRLTELEVNHP